jgi:hypothetical protein
MLGMEMIIAVVLLDGADVVHCDTRPGRPSQCYATHFFPRLKHAAPGDGALFEAHEHAPNLMCPPFPLAGGSQNAAPVQFVSDAAQGRYAIG